MGLSPDLISQFAKVVNEDKKQSSEATVYGTVKEDAKGNKYVQLDGSDQLTPLTDENRPTVDTAMANTHVGNRVSVLIKNHTATVTGNMSAPAASNGDITAGVEDGIAKYDIVVAEKIQAESGYIKNLIADEATIGKLEAGEIRVTDLLATNAEIDNLIAEKATITDLVAKKIDTDVLSAKYATIENLKATDAKIGTLDADVGHINTLMFGSATGDTLHTEFSNSVIALLGEAQIKDAMIADLSASKINAGTINSNNIKIESDDGKMIIADETIQISDDNRVRVQIGKDASDDYSINVWDAEGKLMFSEGGITDAAIKEAIIRDDMVAEDANINGKKIDISSLFTEINGSTETIKSSKVYFDSKGQTLDFAFTQLSSLAEDNTDRIAANETAISVVEGQIESKVWQQDIDAAEGRMGTQYSQLSQTLGGFKTEVSETYTTNDAFNQLSVGARNYVRNGRGDKKAGFFYYFDSVTDDYGEVTLSTLNNWHFINLTPGFCLHGRDYEVGKQVTISFDIRYTCWNFIGDAECTALQMGQRYGDSSSANAVGKWRRIVYVDLPRVGENGCELNEWKHVEETFTIPERASDDVTVQEHIVFNSTNASSTSMVTLQLKNVKIEYGNKATDWTPAPEDLATLAGVNDAIAGLNKTFSDYKSSIEQNSVSITASVSSLQRTTNDKVDALSKKYDEISKETSLKLTDEDVQIKIDNTISDGVKSVTTSTGYKFNEDGLYIAKNNASGLPISPTYSLLNEEGLEVFDTATSDSVLVADKDGVIAKDLTAKNYLIIDGTSRFENYTNFSGTKRTACFWIGE